MKLTDQQIQELFAFTEKKRVFYYDLQLELVDHLAESIEEEMKRDPNLTFENALHKVYKTFGIFGFAKIVQEKQQGLMKSNTRIWWQSVRTFVTIPKIFLTLCVFAAGFLIAPFVKSDYRLLVIMVLWIGLGVVQTLQVKKLKRFRMKQLLLTEFTQPSNLAAGLMFCAVIFGDVMIGANFVFATWLTLAVVSEMAVIEVNRYVYAQARQLYPDAFSPLPLKAS